MGLTLITPPPVEPVTEEQVWDHLRLPLLGSPAEPADKAHVAGLIAAARQHIEGRHGWLGRALVTQTWDWTLPRFPAATTHNPRASLCTPLPPLQSVTSIKYIDTAGVEQTLDPTKYVVDATEEPGRIAPAYGESWPTTRDQDAAVTVRFAAGYAETGSPPDYRANVPQPIKDAMMLLVGHWYAHREAVNIGNIVSEVPMAVDALLTPYRVWSIY